ncbi:MerR family transcriptional regulator [Amorphus coralli]|uniref:MerR family transcriptional regulator n=1 Tax=Amorphus coralli TaxID=340680 RepID=UPI00037B48A5|nr:helix-turn-helix domain-containing protein [Amorphus coralli]
MPERYSIGQLARLSGCKAETIRYYERIRLIPPPQRAASGYRTYGEDDVRRLRFVRHGRELGFPLDAIRALLDLSDHPNRDCAAADRLCSAQLADVRDRIRSLQRLEAELSSILDQCRGGRVADCRVLEALSD